MSLAERLRLQGLPVDYLRCLQRSGVSKRQLGMMIGNAMSGNVLARILRRLLPASGLTG
jgi:site-specific DNA-cytosine methylase